MINTIKRITIDGWLEISAGGVGVLSTVIIDWHHLAERALETAICATINGGLAAVAGYLGILIMKKILPKK